MAQQKPAELAKDAEALRKAWERAKSAGQNVAQRDIAKRHSVHYTHISQLMTGRIPISEYWKLAFAEYLGVRPQDIWEDWPFKKLTNYRVSDALGDMFDAIGTVTNLDAETLAAIREVIARKPRD